MLEIMKEKKGSAPASRSGWYWLGTEKPAEQDESIEEWERNVLDLEKIRITKGK
jgi:hypothetical protein